MNTKYTRILRQDLERETKEVEGNVLALILGNSASPPLRKA